MQADFVLVLSYEILAETPSVIHQNKPKSLGYHHAEAYREPSTQSTVRTMITFDTCRGPPCSTAWLNGTVGNLGILESKKMLKIPDWSTLSTLKRVECAVKI